MKLRRAPVCLVGVFFGDSGVPSALHFTFCNCDVMANWFMIVFLFFFTSMIIDLNSHFMQLW